MLKRFIPFVFALCTACVVVAAEDWPTYLHDPGRSGVTAEQLPAGMHQVWTHEAQYAPAPAWPAPAKQDFWHELRELRPVVTYDRAFHVVAQGESVLFGSSSDDQVYCLDAKTGAVRWTFSCEGPVRLAPSLDNGKAYFGSDDGYAYCVRIDDGSVVWKYRPTDDDQRIPGNGRVISMRPVRTGVVVDAGVAWLCCGLFPPDDVYRCALDAETGQVLWSLAEKEISPQGYMLASPTRLFIPTGRTAPYLYDRATGAGIGPMDGPGGTYALLMDDKVVSGPGRRGGFELGLAGEPATESVATFPCVRMVVSGGIAYLQGKESLRALNRAEYVRLAIEQKGVEKQLDEVDSAREEALGGKNTDTMKRLAEQAKALKAQLADLDQKKEACFAWTRPDAEPYSLILAGSTLYSGGDGKVSAVNAADGQEMWSAPVNGRVYGLSASGGRLYASTDTGAVYCFGADSAVPAAPKVARDLQLADCAAQARDIVAKGGFTKGYCLLLGYEDIALAVALARESELNVLMAVPDEAKAKGFRQQLLAAGLPPVRATAQFTPGDKLPYPKYMANIVVCRMGSVPAKEAYRVVRPYGGTALIAGDKAQVQQWLAEGQVAPTAQEGDWTLVRRGAVEGAGEWTQLYATPSHTACSGDLVDGPLALQWFGEPGPRDIIDRHHRPMSSLFKDGRLFVMGNEKIFTVDAYNGTPLWTLDAPDSRRVAALKNSGHALLADDKLYLAVKNECWVVDVRNGERLQTFALPKAKHQEDWGYLNSVGDRLYGTGQKTGASFNMLSRQTVDVIEGDFRPVVISDYAFCLDRDSGKRKWDYRGGAIMNSCLAATEDALFLIESRDPAAMAKEDGHIRIDVFCRDPWLVALNAKTGKKLWERPVKLPFQHIMYLSGSDGTLLATGSYNETSGVYYGLFGFDMKTGEDKWATSYQALNNVSTQPAEPGGSHGEQWQHPVIIGDTIYSRPYAFDLHTGQKKEYIARRGGHGCGGLTGSAKYLFGRGSNGRMYPTDVASTEGIPLTLVSRPGCWLNIIPAGGLVMIPESSSGCTCAYPLQTSVVLAPKG